VVKSFTVIGEPDREKFPYPPEVYAFRDQAAKATSSQIDWVVAQCAAHADDWAANFYLGLLGENAHKADFAERGYKRTCELLGSRGDRTPKQTSALVVALDVCAGRLSDQKKYDAAAALCRQILDVSKGDAEKDLMRYRVTAKYHLACTCAMTAKTDEAMKWLREAVAALSTFKELAATDPLLASLRPRADFRALVGN
jgi:hypothetical protein